MIYFDNSATTKPYDEVIQSFTKVSSEYFGNPSSLHGLGASAEKLLTQARSQIAEFLHVDAGEILFTSGGTESNNLAIKGATAAYKGRGRHLIASAIEHPSVRESFRQLEKQGFSVTFVSVNENGIIDVDELKKAITSDTILVSVMHINNEMGSIQPIETIGEIVKQHPNILFHVDGVQGAGKIPLNLSKSSVDLYSFSAHKFHGLKGTGGLFVKKGFNLTPLQIGGGQERGQRGGTENPAGAVSMAKALRISMEKRIEGIEKLTLIKSTLREGLSQIKGIKVHTPEENSAPHILNFSLPGIKAEVFVHALEEKGIYVSTTSACSSKKKSVSDTLIAMGVPEHQAERAIRISLSFENTMQEAEIAIKTIKEMIVQLGKVVKIHEV